MRIIIELDSGASPEVGKQPGQVSISEATSGGTDAGRFAGAPAADAGLQATMADGATDAGSFAGLSGLGQASAGGVSGAAAEDVSGGPTPAGAAPVIFDDMPMPRSAIAGHPAAGRDRL